MAPRGKRTQLWKKSKDLDVLDNEFEAKKDDFKITPEELSKTMEMGGQTDRYEKIQPDKPKVTEELIGAQIKQLWEFNELDGNKVNQWCKGTVVAINKVNKLHIQWEEYTLHT